MTPQWSDIKCIKKYLSRFVELVQNLGMWSDIELLLRGWLSRIASPSISMYSLISFCSRLAATDISWYTKERNLLETTSINGGQMMEMKPTWSNRRVQILAYLFRKFLLIPGLKKQQNDIHRTRQMKWSTSSLSLKKKGKLKNCC